jgi:hypothetical protein
MSTPGHRTWHTVLQSEPVVAAAGTGCRCRAPSCPCSPATPPALLCTAPAPSAWAGSFSSAEGAFPGLHGQVRGHQQVLELECRRPIWPGSKSPDMPAGIQVDVELFLNGLSPVLQEHRGRRSSRPTGMFGACLRHHVTIAHVAVTLSGLISG